MVRSLWQAEALLWSLLLNIGVHCSQRLTEFGAKGRWQLEWAPIVQSLLERISAWPSERSPSGVRLLDQCGKMRCDVGAVQQLLAERGDRLMALAAAAHSAIELGEVDVSELEADMRCGLSVQNQEDEDEYLSMVSLCAGEDALPKNALAKGIGKDRWGCFGGAMVLPRPVLDWGGSGRLLLCQRRAAAVVVRFMRMSHTRLSLLRLRCGVQDNNLQDDSPYRPLAPDATPLQQEEIGEVEAAKEGSPGRLLGELKGEGRNMVFVGAYLAGRAQGEVSDPMGRARRYHMLQNQILRSKGESAGAVRGLVDMNGPSLLMDEETMGVVRFQNLTGALATWRRQYESDLSPILARADCSINSLDSFLASTRLQNFFFDPVLVASVEDAMTACVTAVQGVLRRVSDMDLKLQWDQPEARECVVAMVTELEQNGILGGAERYAAAVEEDKAIFEVLASRRQAAHDVHAAIEFVLPEGVRCKVLDSSAGLYAEAVVVGHQPVEGEVDRWDHVVEWAEGSNGVGTGRITARLPEIIVPLQAAVAAAGRAAKEVASPEEWEAEIEEGTERTAWRKVRRFGSNGVSGDLGVS